MKGRVFELLYVDYARLVYVGEMESVEWGFLAEKRGIPLVDNWESVGNAGRIQFKGIELIWVLGVGLRIEIV